MNCLYEKGVISELKCGDNFAYTINDNGIFLPTEYKFLQNRANGTFVKCMKLLFNGKLQLYYSTSGYRPLTEAIHSLDSKGIIKVVSNLFSNIAAVKNSGFLTCQSIDSSFEHIFVDTVTLKTALVYLPVSVKLHTDALSFEKTLRERIVMLINSIPPFSSDDILRMKHDLADYSLTLSDLCAKYGFLQDTEEADFTGDKEISTVTRKTVKLISTNEPFPLEMIIDKDEFLIGKKIGAVDGVIPNITVSRKHCKITHFNEKLSITDLGSANGTFLNEVRLEPERPYIIKNGDVIRLSTSEFKVIIE